MNLYLLAQDINIFCNINHTIHKKNDLLKAADKDITSDNLALFFFLIKIIVFLNDV